MAGGVRTYAAASRAHERVRSLMTAYKLSQALYVVAKLGIGDLLADEPRDADELARATETDASSLRRVLRLLAAVGFLTEDRGAFALTDLGELLVSEAPHSDRAWIIKEGELWWEAWSHLLESVRTGRPGFDLVHGKGLFDYLSDTATTDVATRTLAALSSAGTDNESRAILDAYDFEGFDSVVDVGGGNGSLLLAVLSEHPHLRGVLFDLPYVVDLARGDNGTGTRCELVGGSFFDSVPAGGDVYILRSILHDWDDERARTILRNCRHAVPPHARLLAIEVLMSDAADSLSAALRDVNLMVMTSGRKRTYDELRDLLETSGFEVRRQIALETGFTIVEAVPAP